MTSKRNLDGDGNFPQLQIDLAELRERVVLLEQFRISYQENLWKIERLVHILVGSTDAITLQDLEGRIVAWNIGAERLYGYSESEALEMRMDELVPVLKRKFEQSQRKKLVLNQQLAPYESQRLTKSGLVIDVFLVQSIFGDQIQHINSIDRDLIDRKRLVQIEAEVNELCERLGEPLRYKEQEN